MRAKPPIKASAGCAGLTFSACACSKRGPGLRCNGYRAHHPVQLTVPVMLRFGLVAALAVCALSLVRRFYKITVHIFADEEAEMILAKLGLIGAALVANPAARSGERCLT